MKAFSIRLVPAIAIALLAASACRAQLISVAPMRVLINSGERSTEVMVKNTSTEPVQVTTDLGFKVVRSDANGNTYLDSNVSADELKKTCDSWLKVFPKKFTLEPNASRTVRVVAMPPETLDDGEYWSRLILTSQRVQSSRALSVTDTVAGISAQVNMVTSLGVPVSVRKGTVGTGIEIGDARAVCDTAGVKGALGNIIPGDSGVVVIVDTRRTGNSAYRGTMYASVTRDDGSEVARGEKKFSNLWDLRIRVKLPRIADGSYRLALESKSETNGSTAEAIIPAPPVQKVYRLQVAGATARLSSLTP
jgi:hypothetical protein